MAKPILFSLSIFLLSVFCTSLPVVPPASESMYTNFLNCFKQNNPDPSIPDIVLPQSNPSFPTVLQNYIRNARFNTSSTSKPLIIVTPKQPSHVQSTVICAKQNNIQIKIRSGGHDYEGLSYISNQPAFILLDMFNLRTINVDIQKEVAYVQTDATLGEFR
ncbi:unnamed protein product [Lathyrus oleraceus]